MNRYLLLILIVMIALTACSRKIIPLEGYKLLLEKSDIDRVEDIDLGKATDLIVNRPKQLQLKLEDSVFKYNDTYLSNYIVFKFKALPSKNYSIIVYSYCDCWGFKKYLFNPEVKIIDQSGNPVKIKLESNYFNPNSAPLAYDKTWITEQQINGDCYVILYSDNSRLQKTIYSTIADAYTGMLSPAPASIPVPINIKSTLVGDFRIQLQEK